MGSSLGDAGLPGGDVSGPRWHDSTVHEVFASRVRESPDSVAVVLPDRSGRTLATLTYAELDRRSDALAHELVALGVKPGHFVALYLERSLESIVAVLGSLKAGAAYVPLDPAYPAARIDFMLADTAAPVVLTQSALASRLSAGSAKVVVLGHDWGRDASAGRSLHETVATGSLAYVIYTSGTTGQPKGVCVPHRGILRLVHEQAFTPLDSTRVLLQLAPVSFDAATLEIWGALLHGGRCVLYPGSGMPDLRELASVIQVQGITTLWLTASLFNLVIDQAPETLAGVPEVLTGGETLSVPHVRRALEKLPGTQLVNGYGPTESTTFTCCHRIPRPLPEARSIPIGTPIAHTAVHILDEARAPVAQGIAGRLYIGGDGLATGYLNREDLTAERFIEIPINGTKTRLYDSGDFARWRDDGTIEFLGRSDDQVKIRGYRIELGEVEAALASLDGVRDAIVLAREDDPGDRFLAAYVVAENGRLITSGSLRQSLSERLPEHMIPAAFVFLETLPLTEAGKTDRASLPRPGRERPDTGSPPSPPRTELERWLTGAWQDLLGLDQVGIDDRFFELGGTSLKATRFVAALSKEIGEKVPIVAFFDAPTISLIADVLRADFPQAVAARFGDYGLVTASRRQQGPHRGSRADDGDAIAIIGMAGRFAQAGDIEAFWRNLVAGVEACKPVSAADLDAIGLDPNLLRNPDYVASSFTLDEAECFDAAFFGFTPREAELMDPQQRLFLELAYAAIEDAGYDCDRLSGRVGVFGGIGRNAYMLGNIASHPDQRERLIEHAYQIGNERDFPATHVAYKLNLRGPAVNVQTACSTSGVSLHLACRSLRSGECDMALVGGCKILVPTHGGYVYQEGGALSPDGRVRAFDAKAAGMVRGSGGGVIVLKRLHEAVTDGDHVWAIIKGSAMNNDGADKIGFTAPSVAGQADVITAALDAAGVDADGVTYVETHGTGTILGDPIEVAGLTRAFRRTTRRAGFCAIGSVKTNIGHLDAGASVAGVIKTALALDRETIPPSLNFTEPNPQIDFASSPFFVNAVARPWPRGAAPRRAGVSSFGLGGTNSHVILEEAPPATPSGPTRRQQILVLSARSPAALERSSQRLADRLSDRDDISLGDVAFTLATGRRRFAARRVIIASDPADAVAVLRGSDPRRTLTESRASPGLKAVFLFPGGGAQYPGMAQGLYETETTFREAVDRCAAILGNTVDHDIRDAMFRGAGDLERPSVGLPALFTVEYALSSLWQSWGVVPSAMIGHSMGEYTAACLSGVLTLESALALVTCRGRLFETLPEGGMLSVPLGPDEARRHMGADLDFAAVNRPDQCVVSGPVAAIAGLQAKLEQAGIDSRRIHIAVAAHSRLVAPILDEFRRFLGTIAFGVPRLPWVSNVTGTWIEVDQARSPDYWVDHLRSTGRFSDGLATVFASGPCALVEVGPGQTLSSFAQQHPGRPDAAVVVSSLRHPKESTADAAFLQRSLGRLWLGGVEVDWRGYFSRESRRRVSLPAYPFERRRFWIAPAAAGNLVAPTVAAPAVPMLPMQLEASPPPPPATATPLEEPAVAAAPRADRIATEIKRMIHELSGVPPAEIGDHATFIELGFDSLFLAQVTSSIRKSHGLKVPVRQLIEKTPCVSALAEFLDRELPADAFAAPPPHKPQAQPAPTVAAATTSLPAGTTQLSALFPMGPVGTAQGGAVQQLIVQQLQLMQLMQQQLLLLAGGGPVSTPPVATAVPVPELAVAIAASTTPPKKADPLAASTEPDKSSPWRPVEKSGHAADATKGLTAEQKAHIEALIERVATRAPSSKSYVARYRGRLADPRTVQGFKRQWKEMVFPIVAARTAGSKIWDLDGNEYIDLVNGYGVTFLGHSPSVVTDAVRRQLDLGVEIGPQNRLAGGVAELVCELTGAERAAFCNTGSEAVLAAMRLARTVTGKDKIATFQGHYHGIFDEVLVKAVEAPGGLRALPIAPGIPRKKVEDTIVMKFGDPRSFDVIRQHADEIALVMMEPVRSRNPDLRPVEFIRELRRLTEELGIPLLFDEMVTGFRCHPGGAQAYFGVRADLTTYGKVVGGGYPIGVIAGKSLYLDALDGGMWNYGDDSEPTADMTWFAGTFVRHPVAMAAAHATLTYLKEQGPGLQEALNRRTTQFAEELNAHFQETGAPIWIEHFSSFFVLKFMPYQEYSALLFYHLHNRGIYTYEGRPAFFTTAHSEEDFAKVSAAFKDAVAELQRAGFFPGTPLEETPREIPLAEGQQEIWLATRFGRDASCAFNLSSTLNLKGDLDFPKLRRAMLQLVRRHEALRCVPNPDGLAQRVMPALSIDVPLVDLSGLEDEERQSRLEEIKSAEVRTEFDLDHGPLYRMQVVRLSERAHEVILTVHHVIADGWSCGVLLRDLGRLYAALREGKPHGLPAPMPSSERIADCTSAERGPKRAAALEYWLGQFADAVPVLELPTDQPRPPVKTFGARRTNLTLDATLVQGLRKMAGKQGATLFSGVLAGFHAFLHRLTGQDDLVVGFSLAGQAAVEGRDLVGHCVNFLPLRAHVDGRQPFSDYVKSVRGKVLDASDHQDFTFGALVRRLNVARDPSRTPLMSVAFNLDPSSLGIRFGDLDCRAGSVPRQYDNFDIFFNLVEKESGIEIQCTYNNDLWQPDTMQRRLDEYRTLLEGAVRQPDCPIAQLPLLPDGERRQVLLDWNRTQVDFPRDVRLEALIAEQARRTPELVAVEADDASLTYRELEQRANQLARWLREQGVGRGDRVGLVLDRSLEMVVGLLGTLKSGAAYVPLDPDYPKERLAFMRQDSEAAILLTQERFASDLAATGARVVSLDTEWGMIAAHSLDPVEPEADASDLAYVIYTSGSTGKPKGAMNAHRGIVNRLLWMQQEYKLGTDDRVLQKTPFSFDVSVWEFFWPLLTGARLVMARPGDHRDPEYLVQTICDRQITTIHFVPSMLRVFLEQGGVDSCKSLRRVICSGEGLSPEVRDRFFERLDCGLHNLDGPTEAAVDVTYWECRRDDRRRMVPIGRPVANTRMYVLDERLEPMPVGVPGELHIGGVQVGLGYLGRPELTAERFIPDPFAGGAQARLYKTGDLARWLSDGTLEYLGRLDNQVRVRGFRIEPGEIEVVLAANPQVSQALVVAREMRPGDMRLIAYLVRRGANEPSLEELRRQLAVDMPEHMIPQHFVFVPAMPLTPSGKLDRNALPLPEQAPAEGLRRAPRTRVERVIASAWKEALGIPDLGLQDNFFRLGGHSLLAAQVVARLARENGLALTLRSVFEAPTVETLAALVEKQQPEDVAALHAPIPHRADQREAPASLMQQRLWFLDQLEPNQVAYNVPWAFRLRGRLDLPVLELAINEIIRRHSSIRTTFRWEEDGLVQVVAKLLEIRLDPVLTLKKQSEADRDLELRALLRERMCAPFDLERGPLFRMTVVRIREDEHVFLLLTHHIVWDGWSFDSFRRELYVLYESFRAGRASPLAPLPVTYGDFAAWQRERLQGSELEEHLAYWRRQLSGTLAPLDLPSDRPRPDVLTERGESEWMRFSREETDALRAVAQRHDGTLFMIMLAAFKVLLHRYTGQQDVRVGTAVRARIHPDTQDIIGFFVNTLVLRSNVSPDMPFTELLGRVRSATLGAFSHEEMPFELLVKDLKVPRDMSRAPVVQHMFSFQDARQRATRIADLELELVQVLPPTAQTDITMWFLEDHQGLTGAINYSTDLFDASTIRRMIGHYRTLLAGIAENQEMRVSNLPLLTAAEQDALRSWNATCTPLVEVRGVHGLVTRQAAQTPNAVAVVSGEESVSYAAIDRASDALARHLRSLGVGRGDRVGLCVERTPRMLVALLGVLKSGGTYVPMDPSYPQERLAYMAADSGMTVLVTESNLVPYLSLGNVRTVCLDDAEHLARSSGESGAVASVTEPEDPAYVIYTSGSTGKPKGVVVSHRALANFLGTMASEPGLGSSDRLLAVTTLSFDIATLELLLPLTVGARIVLASRETAADGLALRHLLESSGATVMQATPSTWRLLLEAGWTGSPEFRALCGGEALPRDVAESLLGRVGQLWNLYGHTETTVWSTCGRIEHPVDRITIGRPIANTQVHILDSRRQALPAGVPGEIVIAGQGVAQGYLNRPELTEERFIPDTLAGIGRMYRTGDIGRWLPDGRLECLGRSDEQFKIRGYRIEPGEIEAALASHPAVRQVAVAARPGPGGQRLVAYVVPREGATVPQGDLRKHVGQTLPDYMVPGAFVVLVALPLTPNGKIDRGALPVPELAGITGGSGAVPSTQAQKLVAEVWMGMLEIDHVEIHDNFFDLGGHSLLALRVVSEIERRTGVRIGARALIAQNLEQIASRLPTDASAPPPPGTGGRKRRSRGVLGRLLGRSG